MPTDARLTHSKTPASCSGHLRRIPSDQSHLLVEQPLKSPNISPMLAAGWVDPFEVIMKRLSHAGACVSSSPANYARIKSRHQDRAAYELRHIYSRGIPSNFRNRRKPMFTCLSFCLFAITGCFAPGIG